MNNLTDKWKKGELNRNKVYYYETPFNTADTASGYWLCNHCDTEKDKIEILGEVPSYEEWQASENYIDYLKQCISVYESKDKQATETIIAYNELAEENKELKEILERHKKATAKAQIRSCDLEIINAQLKELLKECRSPINYALCLNLSEEEKIEFKNLLAKIKKVLGEE